MTPTPKMPLPWIANPSYDDGGPNPDMIVGDRFLVAVPLHQNSGGGYDISVITADETGFNDANGESWGAWCWADVEWYIPLDGARKLEDMPDE